MYLVIIAITALILPSVTSSTGTTTACTNDSCGWELVFEVQTGAYDLPGGSDNLDIIITYHDRPVQRVLNVNCGRRWEAETTQTFLLLLEEPRGPERIASIELRASSSVGRWDVDQLVVVARGEGSEEELYRAWGAPLVRFTGEQTSFAARIE